MPETPVVSTAKSTVFGPSAILTPANLVTIARILMAPVAFMVIVNDDDLASWAATGLWFVLSSSDMLDGTLARKYGTTRSGAFLDPLADKILVLGGIGVLCWHGRFSWVPFVLIAVRELAISIYRSTFLKKGLAIPASKLAKWKTFIQLAAVGWVVLPPTTDTRWIANITLWVGVIAGLVSGAQYFIAGSRATTTMAR